jgi:signal transduction histidine kinase
VNSVVIFVKLFYILMPQEKTNKQPIDDDYQRNLIQSTLYLQEKERKRIASVLHEEVGAMLSAARLNLGMILNKTLPANEFDNAVIEAKQMIDETIESIRRISNDLLPSSLEQFGLSRALDELCTNLTTAQIQVIFSADDLASQAINLVHPLSLYRIAQELINNALQHAEASIIEVNLSSDTFLSLSVADNGKGFDTKSEFKNGLGLYDIENRLGLLKGTIDYKSQSGGGTTIIIKLNQL